MPVVTQHLLVAFHLQHIALILLTENSIVGVDLIPNPEIQIGTITIKSSEQIVRFSWPHFLAEILILKMPQKQKRTKPQTSPRNQFSPKSTAPQSGRTLIKECNPNEP